MKIFYIIFISLLFPNNIWPSNVSFLNDLLPASYRGAFELAVSEAKFDDGLDVLGYMDNFSGSKPKVASISEFSASYQFKNGLKFTLEKNNSHAEVVRPSIPKFIETDAETDFYSISYPFSTESRVYEIEFFSTETIQDPTTIDCYEFGTTVIGGSCAEADVKLINSSIYQATGERIYLPVLETTGSSEGSGLNLRIKNKINDSFNISHTISVSQEEIALAYNSTILNTTDPFLRGIKINGVATGDLLDQFKNDLPQQTPWTENIFKYSFNSTYSLSKRLALSGRFTFLKVSRDDYLENPNKEDFNSNLLIDLGFFFELQKNVLFYSRLSLSSQYLLGITPISYNRRTNHLFDHPYGQLYVGTLIKF